MPRNRPRKRSRSHFVEAADFRELAFDGGQRSLTQQPLVNALQGELGRAAGGFVGCAHASAFRRRAISTAAGRSRRPDLHAGQSLIVVFGGQDAVGDGYAGVEGNAGDARALLVG